MLRSLTFILLATIFFFMPLSSFSQQEDKSVTAVYYQKARPSEVDQLRQVVFASLSYYIDHNYSIESNQFVWGKKQSDLIKDLNAIVKGGIKYYAFKELESFKGFSSEVSDQIEVLSQLNFSRDEKFDKKWSESDVNRRKYVFFQTEITKLKLLLETEIGLYTDQNLLVYSHSEEVEVSAEFMENLLNYSSDAPMETSEIGLNDASRALLASEDQSHLGTSSSLEGMNAFEKELLKMMAENNQKMDVMQVQINQLREDQMKIFQQQQEQTNAVLQAQIDNLRGMVIELVKLSNAPELAELVESDNGSRGSLPVENLPSSISIYFNKNSFELNAEYEMMLAEVVDILARHPKMKLLITGMTDQSGNDAYNLDLSRKRAGEVKKFLNQSGLGQERLITKYYGDSKSNSESASDRKVVIEFLAQ